MGYIWVFVLTFITCTGALSSQTSVTARVGSTTVLPCDCSNETKALSSSQSLYVKWLKVFGTVFERNKDGLYQGDGYKGRVDVPKDQLLKGDCSLVLKDVRAEDEGDYTCSLLVEGIKNTVQLKSDQSVELSVEEITETNDNQRRDSSDEKTESRNNLSPGVIIVIVGVIALVLLVLLGAAVFTYFWIKRRTVCGGHGR